VIVGEERALPNLFGSIHIPTAVRDELMARDAPEIVGNFALTLPAWVQLHEVRGDASFCVPLHRGETEAILLAKTLRADALLMDELDGRVTARGQG